MRWFASPVRSLSIVVVFVGSVLFSACSDDDGAPSTDAGAGVDSPASADAGAGADGATTGSSVMSLRTDSYSLATGEQYRCWWIRPEAFDATRAVRAFRPIGGAGVHHLALFWTGSVIDRDDEECDNFETSWSLIAGAGAGTGEMALPDGIAMPIPEGGTFVLQVHIVNSGATPIDVSAGYDLVLTDPGESYMRAGIYLIFSTTFAVPAHATDYVETATCSGNFDDDVTIATLFPHMHQLGSRFEVELASGGTSSMLFDSSWAFERQEFVTFDPAVRLTPADELTIRCHYDNPSGVEVPFGSNTSDEMCAAAFYYYPATRNQVFCFR